MLIMHEGCKMNEKMKLNPKTKQSATKHKVNMTCQDEEGIITVNPPEVRSENTMPTRGSKLITLPT